MVIFFTYRFISKGQLNWNQHVTLKKTTQIAKIVETDIQDDDDLGVNTVTFIGSLITQESFIDLISEETETKIATAIIDKLSVTKNDEIKSACLKALINSKFHLEIYENLLTVITKVIDKIKADISVDLVHESLQVYRTLLESIQQAMFDNVNLWFMYVFPLLFHEKERIRSSAYFIINCSKNADQVLEQMKLLLPNLKNTYCKQMMKLINEDNIDTLKIWKLITTLLGIELHPGTSLINGMLEVLERGFKGKPELRVETFKCWHVLIDNFSLDSKVLRNPKRIKLLMAPFKSNNAKTEELSRVKLTTWWHFICKLQDDALVNFDAVVAPMLRFCFNTVTPPNNTTVGGLAEKIFKTNTAASPGRKYPNLNLMSSEIFTQLLSKGLEPALYNYSFSSIAKLSSTVINSTSFIKHHQLLFRCIKDVYENLDANNTRQYQIGVFLFQSILQHCHTIAILDVNKKDSIEPIKEVFKLLIVLEEQCHVIDGLDKFVFKFIDMISTGSYSLPKVVLNSCQYYVSPSSSLSARDVMNGTPASFLIHIMFKPIMLKYAQNKEAYFTFLSEILRNSNPNIGKLAFLENVMNMLNSTVPLLCPSNPDILLRLWTIITKELVNSIEEVSKNTKNIVIYIYIFLS